MTFSKLPTLIEKRRTKSGWSKAELARRAGVSPSSISFVARGHWNIGLDLLCKIASAFGTTAVKLLSDSTRVKSTDA